MRKKRDSPFSPHPILSLSVDWFTLLGSIGLRLLHSLPKSVSCWLGLPQLLFIILVTTRGVWLLMCYCELLKESKQPKKSLNYTQKKKKKKARKMPQQHGKWLTAKEMEAQETAFPFKSGQICTDESSPKAAQSSLHQKPDFDSHLVWNSLRNGFQVFLPFWGCWDQSWLALVST